MLVSLSGWELESTLKWLLGLNSPSLLPSNCFDLAKSCMDIIILLSYVRKVPKPGFRSNPLFRAFPAGEHPP